MKQQQEIINCRGESSLDPFSFLGEGRGAFPFVLRKTKSNFNISITASIVFLLLLP
jgi:hypothetical protein